MKEANISGNFTNHSLRVTGTTMLFDSGTPEAIIQKRTGHRSPSASFPGPAQLSIAY